MTAINPFTSLGGKLLFAFLIIAGLPAITGLFGWAKLGEVSRNLDHVINETIPAIAQVRGYAEETARIVAVAPELATVTTEAERVKHTAFLTLQVDALTKRLNGFATQNAQDTTGLVRTVAQIRQDISVLDALVRQRIALAQTEAHDLKLALSAADDLIGVADTLVANAEMATSATISDLYEMNDTPDHPNARLDALDKLIEVDLFELGLMTELRSRTAEAGLLLNRIAGLSTPQELGDLKTQMDSRMEIVSRRVREIRDPQRARQAQGLVAVMRQDDAPDGTTKIFATAGQILAITDRIAQLQSSLQRSAKALDDQAASLANVAQDRASAAGAQAMGEIRATQLAYGWAAVVVLAISLAVLWFYIQGNIIRRIDRLSGWMGSLADGKLDIQAAPTGRDEITRMERAFEVFRAQAIAKIALEEEKSRTLDELRMHRKELQRLVADQTETLRAEVTAHDLARSKAEAADRAKSEFLAMMSHEIRTPMNGVLGMIRSLSRDRLTPRQQEYLKAAQTSGEGLMTILNDLLDYSKIDIGGMRESAVVFDPAQLMGTVAVLMRASAAEKGLKLTLDTTDLPHALLGDMAKLRQILFNLLSNAVKFTDQGEVSLRVRQTGDGIFAFRVTDTGRGIHPQAQARIFEAFEQEDAQIGRRYGGTGLGLAISAKFAQLMRGTIAVESTPGHTTFTLTVPLALADPSLLAPMPADLPLGPALRVLVVEDNPINQMVTQNYLEQLGHMAVHVSSAEAALALVEAQSFDAVLMDVNLPGMTGWEATKILRGHTNPKIARLPIIGISAHVLTQDIAAQLAAGMDDFVAKPVAPERLAEALIRSAVSRRSQTAPRAAALDDLIRDLGAAKASDLAHLFLSTLSEQMAALGKAVAQGDVQKVYTAAHSLKGAAGNFALADLVGELQRVEDLAASGQIGPMHTLSGHVAQARGVIMAGLDDLISLSVL